MLVNLNKAAAQESSPVHGNEDRQCDLQVSIRRELGLDLVMPIVSAVHGNEQNAWHGGSQMGGQKRGNVAPHGMCDDHNLGFENCACKVVRMQPIGLNYEKRLRRFDCPGKTTAQEGFQGPTGSQITPGT